MSERLRCGIDPGHAAKLGGEGVARQVHVPAGQLGTVMNQM
jgi:hypothetical protein